MAAHRKLTEDMLVNAVLSLPVGRRRHNDILAELKRLYGVKLSRVTLTQRLKEWGVMVAVEERMRQETHRVVAESIVETRMGSLRSQVVSLNGAEDVIGKLMEKGLAVLANAKADDVPTAVKLFTKAEELMRASAQVRKDMADTEQVLRIGQDLAAAYQNKAAEEEKPKEPPVSQGGNVLDFQELAQQYKPAAS